MTRDAERCIGAESHSPADLWTERHHIFPAFLCDMAGIPRRHEIVPLCGSCHNNVHHAIAHLLASGTVGGHVLPFGSRILVYRWWAWWQEVLSTP